MAELPARPAAPPLVVHVIHRLDVGGMENGLVNLINHMPPEAHRHAIICMTGYTDFAQRIRRDDVSLHALDKREGKDLSVHRRLRRLLAELRPDIVHTRNLATLEAQFTAALAGVRTRVHGEHGWDVGDLDGTRSRNRLLRRMVRPLVGHYIALSAHQMEYLKTVVGVKPDRLSHICNGVDTRRFRPCEAGSRDSLPEGFAPPGTVVIGSVMRMQTVKAPLDLAHAFVALRDLLPERFPDLRLVMVGDGPLRGSVLRLLDAHGVGGQTWLPGARDDVAALMGAMDLFVVPSLAEGICNTILEAMACALPVVATRVGGNPELVREGKTGILVPPANPDALARTIADYVSDADRRHREGKAARVRAESKYSLESMVNGYVRVYDQALGKVGG